VLANQGSAVKFLDVTPVTDYYARSSSGHAGRAVMNMFSCAPRKLRREASNDALVDSRALGFAAAAESTAPAPTTFLFDVRVLERHPFTFQTFVPLALAPLDATTAYLVVVAPTLTASGAHDTASPRGPGLPDLACVRAFLASGDQAVTYAAGTWHAPMVVLGARTVDFVVVQFVNGVSEDDCQEVEVRGTRGGEGVAVELQLVELAEKAAELGGKARL